MEQSVHDKPDTRPLMGRVLVVDDEQVVRSFVQKILEHDGHTVTTADSLHSARSALKKGVDVAVLDVDLPDGEGFELVQLLRERSASPIPIVMITGNPNEEALAKSNSRGITEFLFKPFRGTELKEAIDRALETRERWNDRLGALAAPRAPLSAGDDVEDELESLVDAKAIPPSEVHRLLEALTKEHGLTERENETLGHMLAGLQNAAIADALNISANTVKYHVRNVLTKLGMESRTELFRSLLNKNK